MNKHINLDNITIVLCNPRFPENIGSAARCMRNMGISNLHVVSSEPIDMDRALVLSTHAAADVVKNMRCFETLKNAVAESGYIVGTTARLGKGRGIIKSPAKIAQMLIPISHENKVAIIFGPEDRGLTNEELRNCHDLVHIRTAEFSSINLAQAVMVICYELFNAASAEIPVFTPKLARRTELDAMYEQLKTMLVRICFIQPENPEYWMNRFRHFFSRLPLRSGEVSIIRGICRQVDWYGRKCYDDGKNGREPSFILDRENDGFAEKGDKQKSG